MAPLPPTPKITEISAQGPENFVPFADGWKNENAYLFTDPGQKSNQLQIWIKGENIDENYLNSILYDLETTKASVTVTEIQLKNLGAYYEVDLFAAEEFLEGDTIAYIVSDKKSANMLLIPTP